MAICSVSGCPEISVRKGRCLPHAQKAQRDYDARRYPYRQDYGDRRWRATRRTYLTAHPRCERCGAEATEVHHVDGKGHEGPRGHDPDFLEALCKPCHSRETHSGARGGTSS